MSGNQVGRQTPEKAKIICPPPSGVDIIVTVFQDGIVHNWFVLQRVHLLGMYAANYSFQRPPNDWKANIKIIIALCPSL